MVKIIFFDNNPELIKTYKRILNDFKQLTFLNIDLEDLLNKTKIDGLILPTNSYAVMTGGIDLSIKRKFPKIQDKIFNKIKEKKLAKDSQENFYIPVGQSIVVENNNTSCKYFIFAPTMFLPKDINRTNNIYYTFLNIIKKIEHTNLIIACPGLGTGIGNLSFEESAYQIKFALIEFYTKIKN